MTTKTTKTTKTKTSKTTKSVDNKELSLREKLATIVTDENMLGSIMFEISKYLAQGKDTQSCCNGKCSCKDKEQEKSVIHDDLIDQWKAAQENTDKPDEAFSKFIEELEGIKKEAKRLMEEDKDDDGEDEEDDSNLVLDMNVNGYKVQVSIDDPDDYGTYTIYCEIVSNDGRAVCETVKTQQLDQEAAEEIYSFITAWTNPRVAPRMHRPSSIDVFEKMISNFFA